MTSGDSDTTDTTADSSFDGSVVQLAFDASPEGILVLDALGKVMACNAAAAVLLGDNLIGRPFGLPVSNERSLAEVDVIGPTGEQLVVELRVTPIERGSTSMFLVGVRDITVRKAEYRALANSEERYALAVRGANDGLWDWDVEQRTLHVSARWHEILGLEAVDAERDIDAWFDRVHPEDIAELSKDINAHLAGRSSYLANEHRVWHEEQRYVWVMARGMAVFSDLGVARFAGSLSDISSQRALEERLRHEALHDPLTGLANRRLFLDRLGQLVQRTLRHPAPFALAMLDLDGFKTVNDTSGHDAGDQLLAAIAQRLDSGVRPADTVARLGGDEFAVLFDEVGDVEHARTLAERLGERLAQPTAIRGATVRVTASIGLVLGTSGRSAQSYLRAADEAMFRAKRRGGGVSVDSD